MARQSEDDVRLRRGVAPLDRGLGGVSTWQLKRLLLCVLVSLAGIVKLKKKVGERSSQMI